MFDFTLNRRATSRSPFNPIPTMSSTKTNATAKPTGKSASAKKEIMENFFMKKAQGQREHEFAKGVNTAAEAALRPLKGQVL
jgi:hypothetical protein